MANPSPNTRRTHVIAGDGVAGMTAAQIIRAKCPGDRVVMVSSDPQPFYYRAALTNFLSGSLSDEELWGIPPNQWSQLRLQRVHGRIDAIDPVQRALRIDGSKRLRYDRLLIATGCRARRLSTPVQDQARGIEGADLQGVHVMRSLRDVRQIIESTQDATNAVVLGGGILGMEACHGLHARGLSTTLLHRGKWLLEKVVDRRAGELIQMRMQRDGVSVRLPAAIKTIQGVDGHVRSLLLDDGSVIPADLVVVCIGNIPNTEWLQRSGVALQRGYVGVSDDMRVTDMNDVWAAGDVCTIDQSHLPFQNPSGLWEPARKQGQIAGLAMADPGQTQTYQPGVIYNATKAWDLDLGTLGDHVDASDDVETVDRWVDGKTVYKKLLFRDSRLVGALLLGDRSEGASLRHLMNFKGDAANVSGIRSRILDPSFDLAGWIRSRLDQKQVERWKATIAVPIGINPTEHADENFVTQRAMAIKPPQTVAVRHRSPLSLRIQGELQTFDQAKVTLGFDSEHDIQIGSLRSGEVISIEFDGVLWVLSTTNRRDGVVTLNGKRLIHSKPINRGDSLRIADWFAIVESGSIDDVSSNPKLSRRGPVAQLTFGSNKHDLYTGTTTIGSAADNAVQVAGEGVSWFHAQIHITADPPEILLIDAGSDAGTFVDDRQVFHPTKISDDSVIRFGRVAARLQPLSEQAAGITGEPSPRLSNHPLPSPDHPRFFLQSIGALTNVHPLKFPALLGRSPDADIRIPDPLLSKRHLHLDWSSSSGVVLTDLDSINGVAVNDHRIDPNRATKIKVGAVVSVGNQQFRLADEKTLTSEVRDEAETPTAPFSLTASIGKWKTVFPIDQKITHIGRAEASDIHLGGQSVSRRHCRLELRGDELILFDLDSRFGTRINGVEVSKEGSRLRSGDKLSIGQYHGSIERSSSLPTDSRVGRDKVSAAFRIDRPDAESVLNPNLAKTVQQELDACIGCHECMRACPLEEAATVSIGALNAYAIGAGKPSTATLDFVDKCTQCQACVPVCPADIRRSRIVLFNKLKQVPDHAKRPPLQVQDRKSVYSSSIGELNERYAEHPLLGVLHSPQRMRLLAHARFRQLFDGERLVTEGEYLDTAWLIESGSIHVGLQTTESMFQHTVTLLPGQCIGESTVIADQPSDVGAISKGTSILMGFSKYAMRFAMNENSTFKNAVEKLYLNQSVQSFLSRLPSLADLEPHVLNELLASMIAERYEPGSTILSGPQAEETFALLKRGFVKEVRCNPEESISNYLKRGDAFGLSASRFSHRGQLARFESATQAEVLTLSRGAIAELEKQYPGMRQRLTACDPQSQVARGQTAMISLAAADGLLQARQLLVIDTRSCVDCDNCVSACRRRHGAARFDRSGSGKQVGPNQIPASCFHCEDPVCLLCSVDGIVRLPDGEISIIDDNCIGCGGCAERCPYDNIEMISRASKDSIVSRLFPQSITDFFGWTTPITDMLSSETVATKCDLCAGYDNGPACVRSCPTGAAMRVDPIEHFTKDRMETTGAKN